MILAIQIAGFHFQAMWMHGKDGEGILTGFEIAMIETLASKYDFILHYSRPADGQFGKIQGKIFMW